MYKVYNAKLLDKVKAKTSTWSKGEGDFFSLIPTLNTGELSFFQSMSINNQKLPAFIEYIKITKLMVFHHMFIGSYGLIVISSWRGGLGDCVFSFMFMMEFSTPFVSFRAILSILNLKKSKIFVINGILMLVTFTIFRILMLPTLLYYYSTVINLPFLQALLKLPLGCQLSILALFIPQFYWFNLMLRVALKVRKKSKNAPFPFTASFFLCRCSSHHQALKSIITTRRNETTTSISRCIQLEPNVNAMNAQKRITSQKIGFFE
jgi:TLC domain